MMLVVKVRLRDKQCTQRACSACVHPAPDPCGESWHSTTTIDSRQNNLPRNSLINAIAGKQFKCFEHP